jgi:hypothetical protein
MDPIYEYQAQANGDQFPLTVLKPLVEGEVIEIVGRGSYRVKCIVKAIAPAVLPIVLLLKEKAS